jgi:hypothetical protein
MAREQSERVAELEGTAARLQQRERRLRAVLKSAFTGKESRRDARQELESLLNKTDEVEDELLLLESPDGLREKHEKARKNKVDQRSGKSRVRNKDS